MVSMRATVDWSELPSDLYDLIFNHLDLLDLVRVAVVCRSWLSAWLANHRALKLPKTPWLLLSAPKHPQSRCFQFLTDQNPDRKHYEIHLPQISRQRLIGSSEGFLISVDESGKLHAINPLTRAHLPLPTTDTLAARDDIPHCFFGKAVLAPSPSPDKYNMVIITASAAATGCDGLAFARSGDALWTVLKSPIGSFQDVIFHNGRLHAVNFIGTLAIFDPDNPWISPTLLPQGPPEHKPYWLRRFLVESPDGDDLFLVLKELEESHRQGKEFKVLKLNKDKLEWEQIKSIGDIAMFLGFNHSVSFSTRDFPHLQKNSIYFTYDESGWHPDRPRFWKKDGHFWYLACCPELARSGLLSLEEDAGIQQFSISWPMSTWYTPALS